MSLSLSWDAYPFPCACACVLLHVCVWVLFVHIPAPVRMCIARGSNFRCRMRLTSFNMFGVGPFTDQTQNVISKRIHMIFKSPAHVHEGLELTRTHADTHTYALNTHTRKLTTQTHAHTHAHTRAHIHLHTRTHTRTHAQHSTGKHIGVQCLPAQNKLINFILIEIHFLFQLLRGPRFRKGTN